MKSKKISFKVGSTHPYFVLSREFRNGSWEVVHLHYYKHEYMQTFRVWIENKVIFKIRNWFIRRK